MTYLDGLVIGAAIGVWLVTGLDAALRYLMVRKALRAHLALRHTPLLTIYKLPPSTRLPLPPDDDDHGPVTPN